MMFEDCIKHDRKPSPTVCRDRGRMMWMGGGLVPVLLAMRFVPIP